MLKALVDEVEGEILHSCSHRGNWCKECSTLTLFREFMMIAAPQSRKEQNSPTIHTD